MKHQPHFYACYDLVRVTPDGNPMDPKDLLSPFVYAINTTLMRDANGNPIPWNTNDPNHNRRLQRITDSFNRLLSSLGSILPPGPVPEPIRSGIQTRGEVTFRPQVRPK